MNTRRWTGPSRHWLLFAGAFVIALLLQWPLAQLARQRSGELPPGVAIEEVRGSLWSAQAIGVHWQGRRIPSVPVAVAPASLLRGEPRITPAWPGAADAVQAAPATTAH